MGAVSGKEQDMDTKPGTVRVGVDVGQAHDYTAIIVTEEVMGVEGRPLFHARSIERLPLGTTYEAIAERTAQIVDNLHTLDERRRAAGVPGFQTLLLVDAIGTGRPVIEMMHSRKLKPISITLTGGDGVIQHDRYTVSVGKSFMIGAMQALLQNEQWALGDDDLADIVIREAQAYQIKVSEAGHASFAARSGAHDDLVCAAGLSILRWRRIPPRRRVNLLDTLAVGEPVPGGWDGSDPGRTSTLDAIRPRYTKYRR